MTDLAPTIWRAMTPDDLDATIQLAGKLHTDYPEDNEIFMERLALSPEGCFVLQGPEKLEGYMLSHPWRGTLTPALNTLLHNLPAQPDRWYLHDIALTEDVRGQGCAQKAISLVEQAARHHHLSLISLISTRHALGFWHKQGFMAENTPAEEQAVLASYDPYAQLLSRPVCL